MPLVLSLVSSMSAVIVQDLLIIGGEAASVRPMVPG
jgi:hypothetical protein